MRIRKGRLNITKITDEKVIKVGIVKEKARPCRLKVEGWALAQAAKRKGVNVPKVLDYYRDTEGREVLVLQRIEGKSFSLRNSQENIESMFSVGSQMRLLSDLGEGFGWIDPVSLAGSSKNWKSFLSFYVSKYGARLVRKDIIDSKLLLKLHRVLEKTDLEISISYLVNRDLKPSNIMQDDRGEIWILDWEDVILGDPLYDLAVFGARYGHIPLWESMVEGYGLDVSLPKYALYEVLSLVGMVDFEYNHHMTTYPHRREQLNDLISRHSGF